jgi:hypothetical protein
MLKVMLWGGNHALCCALPRGIAPITVRIDLAPAGPQEPTAS